MSDNTPPINPIESKMMDEFERRKDPMSRETKIHLGFCGIAGLGMVLFVTLTNMSNRIIHFGLLHSPMLFIVVLLGLACAAGVGGFIGYRRCKPYPGEAKSRNPFLAKHSWWIRPLIAFITAALVVYFLTLCARSLFVYNMPETFGARIMVLSTVSSVTPGKEPYIVAPTYLSSSSTEAARNQTTGGNETSSTAQKPGFFGSIWDWITGLFSSKPTSNATSLAQTHPNKTNTSVNGSEGTCPNPANPPSTQYTYEDAPTFVTGTEQINKTTTPGGSSNISSFS